MTDSPVLDSRTRADIAAAAATATAQAVPGWVGGPADPGAAVLASGADMAAALAEQVNRVPERMRRRVLHDLRVRPVPPAAATASVTFTVTDPPERSVRVPAGSEVATEATGPSGTVVFTTVRDAVLLPTTLTTAGAARDWRRSGRRLQCLFTSFEDAPAPLPAAADPEDRLFVLTNPVPSTVLTVTVTVTEDSVPEPALPDDQGLVEPLPPTHATGWVWEAWEGHRWMSVAVRDDTTDGLRRSGLVTVEMSPHHTAITIDLLRDGRPTLTVGGAGLLRCRRVSGAADSRPVDHVALQPVVSLTAPVVQAEAVYDEVLGVSTGLPGQTFTLARTPLADTDLRVIATDGSGRTTVWTVTDSFVDCTPADHTVTVDPVTGLVAFPPAHGTQPGALPAAGARVSVPVYRSGGGACGNVDTHTITVVRTPLPQIASVTNHVAATGGSDAQPLGDALTALPPELPGRMRAVSGPEYAVRAVRAGAGAARAVCLPAAYAHGVRALTPLLSSRAPVAADTVLTFTGDGPQFPHIERGSRFRTRGGLVFTTTENATDRDGGRRARARQVVLYTTPVTAQSTADGRPGFVTAFPYTNLTTPLPQLKVGDQPWELVDDFRRSGPHDHHAVLDPVTGTVYFGPLLTYGPGAARQYGAVPSENARITLAADAGTPLAVTRGSAGDTPADTITYSDTAGITVTNERAAAGGADGVSLPPDTDPGARHQVTILALPAPPPHPSGRIPIHQLTPTPGFSTGLRTALHPTTPPNTAITVLPFDFTTVGIRAAIHTDAALTGDQRRRLAQAAEHALYRWLHPLTGGRDRLGWPLGHTITIGEARAVLDTVPGTHHTLGLELCSVDPDTGIWSPPHPHLLLSPIGLVHCAEHCVAVLPAPADTPVAPLDTVVPASDTVWVSVRSSGATAYSLTSRQVLPAHTLSPAPDAVLRLLATPLSASPATTPCCGSRTMCGPSATNSWPSATPRPTRGAPPHPSRQRSPIFPIVSGNTSTQDSPLPRPRQRSTCSRRALMSPTRGNRRACGVRRPASSPTSTTVCPPLSPGIWTQSSATASMTTST
ncbi:hypothetical protein [Nocardia terpenica]|uniref:Baseplate protein J-like domain-containing protein n=1 Tax=Nocardia terpenica TaxID=455432 RepID=A0A6G9ZDK5_9NOCA|nr:hypothetical protein [Nocardia terpenica]QIS23520.1 hypothetical protein F6W96_39745 [Nocardia terpenica]